MQLLAGRLAAKGDREASANVCAQLRPEDVSRRARRTGNDKGNDAFRLLISMHPQDQRETAAASTSDKSSLAAITLCQTYCGMCTARRNFRSVNSDMLNMLVIAGTAMNVCVFSSACQYTVETCRPLAKSAARLFGHLLRAKTSSKAHH